MKKKRLAKIISILLLFIGLTFFSISLYLEIGLGGVNFEQLLFSFKLTEGTGGNLIIDGIIFCLPIVLIFLVVLSIPMFIKYKKEIYLKFNFKKKNKEFKLKIFPLNSIFCSVVFLIVMLLYLAFATGLIQYVINQFNDSTIFEDYYVEPNSVELEFPEKKRNLIYIYLESMESSYSSITYDGKELNMIPNLEKIANNNINFSQTNGLGGGYQAYGCYWTVAAMVAHSAGIPLKITTGINSYDHFSGFLPGVTSLGDILEKEGYNQTLFIGSPAEFAGRDIYFSTHGNYNIKDYNYAKDNGIIDDDYFVFWGYEDKKLFEFAKDEILRLANEDEPFNFTMLTVDTHAVDGYNDETCKHYTDYVYGNTIMCSEVMVTKFLEWIQKQDFYKDTTVILTGDHVTMQGDILDFYNTDRTIYNAFINTGLNTKYEKNRIFNSFDMFPTTLASIGVKIEGNRLGLGTNLFSGDKTLSEELGVEYLEGELSKNSNYYNLNFLRETFIEMEKEESQEE